MRKLIVTFILAGLAAVPAAFAATDASSFAPVRDALTDTPADYSVPADFSQARTERRRAERLPQVRERRVAERREARRAEARRADTQAAAVPPQLQAIATCESGGDPTSIGGGGLYRGKYQFSVETWAAVGGSGDPATAPEAEQDKRAAVLYEQSGPGQWPNCAE